MDEEVSIRLMNKEDVEEADRIVRLAFGTFRGYKNPLDYRSDCKYAYPRFSADPSSSFVAEHNGKIIGSNFGLCWGSLGIFGPLSVHPDYWDAGIGSKLMEPVIQCFKKWKVSHSGAMTFANSPKHIHLYRKFGYYPRFLIPVMSKKLSTLQNSTMSNFAWITYSDSLEKKYDNLNECKQIADTVFKNLNLSSEIKTVDEMKLGDTVLLFDESKKIVGFAVCHCGSDTEAGNEKCYIKFGAVRANSSAKKNFLYLLKSCEESAVSKNLSTLIGGVNAGRTDAFNTMLNQKFSIDFLGVSLNNPNNDAFNVSDRYVIDDWR